MIFGNAIALNMTVDLSLMIAVVTQRVENLCEREMWQVLWDFLRCNALTP